MQEPRNHTRSTRQAPTGAKTVDLESEDLIILRETTTTKGESIMPPEVK